MSTNINNAHCLLVGICCLKGGDRTRVLQEWNSRFRANEVFWVDAQSGQKAPDIARGVAEAIAGQGIVAMAGKTLVVSVFLDLMLAPDEALIQEILQVPVLLQSELGCNIPLTMEFGFLDLKKLAFTDKTPFRSNAKRIVELNGLDTNERRQLCLVATSPLVRQEDDSSWKAVVVFLDVLRRVAAPASIVPIADGSPNDDIGFLRYGEYDQQKLEWLTGEKARLNSALGNGGDLELQKMLDLALGKIERDIEANYVIDGNLLPLHPEMKVEGKIAQWQASRGRNTKYETARHSVWLALEQTGKNLQEMILAAYRPQIADAAAWLARFTAEAKVGIEVESDRNRMNGILQPQIVRVNPPQAPSLAYQEGGCVREMQNYLEGIRRHTVSKVQSEFIQALLDAYKRIPDAHFAEKRSKLLEEQGSVNIRLGNVMGRDAFIDLVAGGADLPETSFQPKRGGGRKINLALCRDKENERLLDSACGGTVTSVYFIDEKYGGLKTVDDAPIKALQVLMFNCDEDRQKDLIR